MIPVPSRVPAAQVDCGPCQACCHQWVILTDEEVGYEVESVPTPEGVMRFLKRKNDGSCIYLTPEGCGIHELRPACCRRFHCGKWYETLPRAARKEGARRGESHVKRMLREGRRRARRAPNA